jgi:hypothetical protein
MADGKIDGKSADIRELQMALIVETDEDVKEFAQQLLQCDELIVLKQYERALSHIEAQHIVSLGTVGGQLPPGGDDDSNH